MSRFTERLWRELERDHGADLAQIARPATKPTLRKRPQLLAGTSLGLTGIGLALTLALNAASSPPAFAVTRNHDGTVTLQIKAVKGIQGANAKLAQLGIRARAVQVEAGCLPPAGAPAAVQSAIRRAHADMAHAKLPPARFLGEARIDPKAIPAGHILVLPAMRVGHTVRLAVGKSLRGQAPGCFPFPAPDAFHASSHPGHICHVGPLIASDKRAAAALTAATDRRLRTAGTPSGGHGGEPSRLPLARVVECLPGSAGRSG